MSALLIVRSRLIGVAAVTQLVPKERIISGVIPPGTAAPVIGLTEVSATDRVTLKVGAKVKVTSRVQITVAAATIPDKNAIMKAVRQALRQFIGPVATPKAGTFDPVTIRTEGRGPDFEMPGASLSLQTQDVIVTYDEDA